MWLVWILLGLASVQSNFGGTNGRAKVILVAIGDYKTITCPTKGPMPTQIFWSSQFGRPLPSHMSNDRGKLKINGFKQSDQGLYQCEAIRGNRVSKETFWVELRKASAHPDATRTTKSIRRTTTRRTTTTEETVDITTPFCHPRCSHGSCVARNSGTFCRCDEGYTGPTCESETMGVFTDNLKFSGNSHVEFSRFLLTQSHSGANLTVSMTISTTSAHGVLLWIGDTNSNSKDYMSLRLVQGSLELSASLGLHPIKRICDRKINDGEYHNVAASLLRGSLVLTVDNYRSDSEGSSNHMKSGKLVYLNTQENILVGGLGRVDGPKYPGFNGCITNVRLNDQQVLFSKAAKNENIGSCN